MTDSPAALERLAGTLDVPVERLDYLRRLDPAHVGRLDSLVGQAILRDEAAIDRGMERTLRFLPRPLRGRARRMLVPEEER